MDWVGIKTMLPELGTPARQILRKNSMPALLLDHDGGTAYMSREERVSKLAIRLATLTVLSGGIIATAPTMPVFAAGGTRRGQGKIAAELMTMGRRG
jgi:hypothetical protein